MSDGVGLKDLKMALSATAHQTRFKKWRNLAAPQTRELSTAVFSQLVPMVESYGFERVNIHFSDPESSVSGSEIALERVSGALIDSITFNFEKYRTPRFQLHASRREATFPHQFVRSCNLVARSSQYYHFWGKPWWLPARFWPEYGSTRTIETVAARIHQLIRYLETGDRGPNISRLTSALLAQQTVAADRREDTPPAER